ncbi:hypothetical protein SETIT_1G208000v2 [Setaria italica]|uniref:Secreted protein n=1 Tax=Setaria italica TaxID=4555 RepID=A0A368PMH1_SETIT|nr:hypothetical protein SETIT_1G208000v2 [Setaria italica]
MLCLVVLASDRCLVLYFMLPACHRPRWWCCGHGGAVWRHHIVDGYGALHQSKGLVGGRHRRSFPPPTVAT